MAGVILKDLLSAKEKKTLEQIYKSFRVATDQLRRSPDVLHAIAAGFERLESRRIEPSLLLRYMFNRRKLCDWPKLGKRAEKFPSLLNLLGARELAILESGYTQIGRAVDAYQFAPKLARTLAELYNEKATEPESAEVLVAVMTARRKRGLWPALFEDQATGTRESGAFADIDIVAKQHKKHG